MLNGLAEILAKHELSDEIKALLTADVNAATDGLSGKNTELLGKLSDKDNLTAAEKEKLIQLETFKTNADIASAKAAEDWQAASDLQAKSWADKDLAKDERITNYENSERTRLITDGIRSELTGLKVNPLHSDTVTSFFESKSKVVDGKAMIGDQTQSEFINAWAATDSGKASLLAHSNTGGDGQGGSNQSGQPAVNQAALDAEKKGDIQGYLKAVQSTT